MVRLVNRFGDGLACQATRDMGVRELNNAYEDAELADTLVCIGGDPGEAQAHYFAGHWIPNLRGATLDKKAEHLPGESSEAARVVFIDPRHTASVTMAGEAAGRDRVLHLPIFPGSDLALFNGLLTHVVEKGWHDREWIAAHTTGFDGMLGANRLSLDEAARVTGLAPAQIEQAACWMFEPKAGRARRRTLFAYAKGLLWGGDPHPRLAALMDLVLATHNVGRPGTGAIHLGGHQEGFARPSPPGGEHVPAVDGALIQGRGRLLTVWGCNALRATPDAAAYREALRQRSQVVREAMTHAGEASTGQLAEPVWQALANRGGLFVTAVDPYPVQSAQAAHLLLPAARPGEMNVTSMNGERRVRLAERFMDPPGAARPDCLIAADIANALRASYAREGDVAMARRFEGFEWQTEEDAFKDGFAAVHAAEFGSEAGRLVTYERLRAMGTDGVQLPVRAYRDGKLLGTKRLYTDGRFDTADGRARFVPAPWSGPVRPHALNDEQTHSGTREYFGSPA
jgi:arsenite oxidase large subunit